MVRSSLCVVAGLTTLGVLVSLLSVLPAAIPQTNAPPLIARFDDNVGPAQERRYTLDLLGSENNFLLHVRTSTPGTPIPFDAIDIAVEQTGLRWGPVQGEWWFFCDCQVIQGSYALVVTLGQEAAQTVTFSISFHRIPSVPVTFEGTFLPDAGYSFSSFVVNFPSSGAYEFLLDAPTGGFGIHIDGERNPRRMVTGSEIMIVELDGGAHYLEVENLSGGPMTSWTVDIRGPRKPEDKPYLRVTLEAEKGCELLDESVGQFTCRFRAGVSASDGSSPPVNFLWSTNAGTLSSAAGQEVQWTAPRVEVDEGMRTIVVSVEANAQGYEKGEAAWVVAVMPVPEFPALLSAILLIAILQILIITRRSRGQPSNDNENQIVRMLIERR